jgi:hypothetical protein
MNRDTQRRRVSDELGHFTKSHRIIATLLMLVVERWHIKLFWCVRSQFLAVSTTITVFWHVTLCSVTDQYRRSGGACFLCFHGRKVSGSSSEMFVRIYEISRRQILEGRNLGVEN